MSELDAVLVAGRTGGTIFKYLNEGERFTFTPPGGKWKPVIYTKVKRGWYSDALGRKFRAGARSAVFRLREEV